MSTESGTVAAIVSKEMPGSCELIMFLIPMAVFGICGESLLQCCRHQSKCTVGFLNALLLCCIKCQGSWSQVNSFLVPVVLSLMIAIAKCSSLVSAVMPVKAWVLDCSHMHWYLFSYLVLVWLGAG